MTQYASRDFTGTNPVSPILEDLRLYRAERLRMNNPKGYDHILRKFDYATSHGYFVTNNFEHVENKDVLDHARRVLERLVSLEESS
ncbi:hypothetical protein SEA_CECE_300 [Microbacterium phage Cece]|nr:hypothetical protein SEA_CECE_300 [Microbacterium phage Cece]